MLGVIPELVVFPILALVMAAVYVQVRWWPLRRLRRFAERDGLVGVDANRIKVTFEGHRVSAADYAALWGPFGLFNGPPESALNRSGRSVFTTIKWSDDDPVIHFSGAPPKWLRNALVSRAR